MDIDSKLNNYLKIRGNINNTFRPQTTLKKTKIKLYNALVIPGLLYGSENWGIKATDTRRITAAEMKCTRKTAGHTWTDYRTNTEIAKEINITTVWDKIQKYGRNWLQHENRTTCNRLLRIIKKNYRPKGRRNQGRPLKRILEE